MRVCVSPSLVRLLLESPLSLPGSITNNAVGDELLAGLSWPLSLWEPSDHLFFLYVLLADQKPFLTAAEANGGTKSHLVFRVLAWAGGLNPTSHPNSCPELPLVQSSKYI